MRFQSEPNFRRRDAELIPRPMLWACAAIVLAALSFTTFAVVTDRPAVGTPAPAAAVAERWLTVENTGAQSVLVRDPSGAVVLHLEHGGFIAVVQNGLARARHVRGADQAAPVRLVEYANGRLALEDPQTGWSVELGAFGDKNRAVWAALLNG